MAEFVEFYLNSNPPLLPEGVALVISHAQEAFYPDKMFEILYEPEVPWFKIIGPISHKNEVLNELGSYLCHMLMDQVGLIDEDVSEGSGVEDIDEEPRADVELISESPLVVPWGKYVYRNYARNDKYSAHGFPEVLDEFPYRLAWRGLGSVPGLEISDVLSRYSFLWPQADSEPTVQRLGELTGCVITHNMRGDLIYIGSKKGPECLVACSRKLENLLGFHKPCMTPSAHVVFPESIESYKLCMRWLTHVGLDKLTYSKTPLLDVVMEPESLACTVTVRVYIAHENGHEERDKTAYQPVRDRAKNFSSKFGAFADFRYPAKSRGVFPAHEASQSSLLDSASELSDIAPLENTQESRDEEEVELYSSLSAHPSRSGKKKFVTPEGDPKSKPLPTGVDTEVKDEGLAAVSRTENTDTTATILQNSMSSTEAVTSWIDSIEAANEMPRSLPSTEKESSLTRELFNNSVFVPGSAAHALSQIQLSIDNVTPHEPSGPFQAEPARRPSTPRTEEQKRNECLLDSDSPTKLNYGMFSVLDLTSNEQNQTSKPYPPSHEPAAGHELNLMDDGEDMLCYLVPIDIPTPEVDEDPSTVSIGYTAVLDAGRKADDSIPVFDKQEDDNEQEFYLTMNQKTGAPSRGYNKAHLPKTQGVVLDPQCRQVELSAPLKPSKINSHTKRPVCSTQEMDDDGPRGRQRLVPGMDMQPPKHSRRSQRNPRGIAQCIRDIEHQAKEVFGFLQVIPGDIKLEVRLGRLCMKGVGDSFVSVGNGPYWRREEFLSTISHPYVKPEFHTILTTNGAEAETMPGMVLSKGEPWSLNKKKVYYDFVCEPKYGNDLMVVEVDASTFAHVCKPLDQDLPGVYIHCARRAWDIKLSVTRGDDDAIPQSFRSYTEHLVKSLNISTTEKGQVRIEAGKDAFSRWRIKDVQIRHVAQYRKNPKSSDYLCISMTRAVDRKGGRPGYHGVTTVAQAPGQGPMTQWFEAWFGSKRADKYMRQNKVLEFGEKTTWTPEQLIKDGVIKSICEPALRMVTQMDQVGQTNYSSQGPEVGGRNHTAQIELGKDEPFW